MMQDIKVSMQTGEDLYFFRNKERDTETTTSYHARLHPFPRGFNEIVEILNSIEDRFMDLYGTHCSFFLDEGVFYVDVRKLDVRDED